MISTAIVFLLASSQQGAKIPTYEDVQKGMYIDARKLTGYTDEWDWVLTLKEVPQKFSISRKLDGVRNRFEFFVDGKRGALFLHDGKTATVVIDGQKLYGQGERENESFTTPWEKLKAAPLEQDTFDFRMTQYEVRMASNPTFVVKSLETTKLDNVVVRKMVCEAVKESKKGRISLKVWFDADRWIPRRIDAADGISEETGAFSMRAVRTKVNMKAVFQPSDFSIELSQFPDYQSVPISQILGGSNP